VPEEEAAVVEAEDAAEDAAEIAAEEAARVEAAEANADAKASNIERRRRKSGIVLGCGLRRAVEGGRAGRPDRRCRAAAPSLTWSISHTKRRIQFLFSSLQ
jgi:hypothetical protein